MTALARLAGTGPAQKLLRSGPARRLTTQLVAAQRTPEDLIGPYAAWAELERRSVAPLVEDAAQAEPAQATPLAAAPAPAGPGLRVAFVVPEFRRGSGGHTTIANLVRGLERRGHACSIWIHDPLGRAGGAEAFRAFFGPFAAPVHDGLEAWTGTDVAVATGWQTVAPVLLLDGCRARAHLVQDSEPDFYPASAERLWAEQAEARGLAGITAGSWLAERIRARGGEATSFDLGIDHAVYRPQPAVTRAPERVLFYARAATPRRAVPLGMLALQELARRRPSVEIALFGDPRPPAAPFPFTQLGILDPPEVSREYAQAAVGLVLSLTNHSLVAQEMLACGLPVVELETPSTVAAFGDSPIVLAPATVLGLADALEQLLGDAAKRAERLRAGVEWASKRTWEAAAASVEAGLRAALHA